jgi:acyl carrier protein
MDKLLNIINAIRENKGEDSITIIKPDMTLREDLEFDSLDLAELTVKVEKEFGVDIFENGIIYTVDEILNQING